MSLIDTIYLCIAGAIILLSFGNRRGTLWVLAVAASFFGSGAYWRYGGPSPELFAGLCDGVVVALIIAFGIVLWELWVGAMVLIMVLVNFASLLNQLYGIAPIPHLVYSLTLEVLNLCVLLLIGGVSAFMQKGSTDGAAFHPWLHIFGFSRPFVRANR